MSKKVPPMEEHDSNSLPFLFVGQNDYFSEPHHIPFFHHDNDNEDIIGHRQQTSEDKKTKQERETCHELIDKIDRYLLVRDKHYHEETREDKLYRYLIKRHKRVWDKKINYKCRQNVAKNRTREKGRFVSKNQLKSTTICNQQKFHE